MNALSAFGFAIAQCASDAPTTHSVTAFSDCAFFVGHDAAGAAKLAIDLMRSMIRAQVPVRMGLGCGTFDALPFSSEDRGHIKVHQAMFVGTGVVNAHHAEQCGLKGMRIFVHPSAVEHLSVVTGTFRLEALTQASTRASHELDYLHEDDFEGPIGKSRDAFLMSFVRIMQQTSERAVHQHYQETYSALDRMRRARGREPL